MVSRRGNFLVNANFDAALENCYLLPKTQCHCCLCSAKLSKLLLPQLKGWSGVVLAKTLQFTDPMSFCLGAKASFVRGINSTQFMSSSQPTSGCVSPTATHLYTKLTTVWPECTTGAPWLCMPLAWATLPEMPWLGATATITAQLGTTGWWATMPLASIQLRHAHIYTLLSASQWPQYLVAWHSPLA